MKQRFIIPGRFDSLNEFYRAHYMLQKTRKAHYDGMVMTAAKLAKIKPVRSPVIIHVHWIEKNRRRDLDNIRFGMKFIQDGLVKAGILFNDSPQYVVGHTDMYSYDSVNPRIEVTIEEVGNATN